MKKTPTDGSFTLSRYSWAVRPPPQDSERSKEARWGITTSMRLIDASFSLVENAKITHRSFNLNRKKQESILVYDEIER